MKEENKSNLFLVAVDGSDNSQRAFRFAMNLMKETDKLTVIHVNLVASSSLLDPFHDNIDRAFTTDQAILGKKIEKEFNQIITKENLENKVNFICLNSADVRSEIVNQATSLNAHTIIVGNKGHTLLENLLIGSTANWLVKNSKIPVLIVK